MVGEEDRLIGFLALPVGDSSGWDGSHGLGAALHEIPRSWTAVKLCGSTSTSV